MTTYDILENLGENCLELLNASLGLKHGTSLRKSHKKIEGALRKIIIANEMTGRGIICITGLQGAGKTSFIKNFYGLDEKYFNIKKERGEKIPVFICEKKNCHSPEMYAVCLKKNEENKYERCKVQMNENEFIAATSSEESEEKIMYLELCIPYTHLHNESFCFMLLPGYEKKIDYWQTLIDFSVKCSDTAICVFNDSSFANYNNQVLLENIKERFGNKLIYAISQSDMRDDENANVKNTCIETMGIISGEEDRVVCIGQFKQKEKNDLWIQKMKSAIEKYCNSMAHANRNFTEYIYEIIEDEIRPELETIQDCIEEDTGEEILTHLNNSSYINTYDKLVEKRREQLEKQLDIALEQSLKRSSDRLTNIFTDGKYAEALGVKDKRIFQRTVFGENVKDIVLAKKRIEVAMKSEQNEDVYDFQYAFVEAIGQTVLNNSENNECKKLLCQDKKAYKVSTDVETDLRQEMIFKDVSTLLVENIVHRPVLEYDNIKDTLKVIAELGTQHFAIATLQQCAKQNNNLEIPQTVREKLVINNVEVTNNLKNVEKTILGTLGITGVDLLNDGVLNAVPALAKALGLSVPIVGTAVTLIAGTVYGTAIANDINRLQRAELGYAQNALYSMGSKIKTSYLNSYDEAMILIRNRLEDNLINISGVNKKMVQKTNVRITISNIEKDLDTICREVTKTSYDLRQAFG